MIDPSLIRHDPHKQKVRECKTCKTPVVVGRFGANEPLCAACESKVVKPTKPVDSKPQIPQNPFITKLVEMANKYGFSLRNGQWKKQFSLTNGGVGMVTMVIEPSTDDKPPRLMYFTYSTQIVIDVAKELRRYMPEQLAVDCEAIASELADIQDLQPQVGMHKCARCGSLTDQFGTVAGSSKTYCVKPNDCLRVVISTGGAESSD